MNHSEKVKILKDLSEEELRRELLIPLLSKMGFRSPIEYHSSREKGKDIICYEYNKLSEVDYFSIVAKTTDITGSVSSSMGLMNILNQVEQSFDNKYDDVYSMKSFFINEVWVVTTGKLLSGAQESFFETLRKRNLDKRVKIIYNDKLVELIDRHYETFWNLTNETKEKLIIQRDRLLKYFEQLLIRIRTNSETIETIKNQILTSDDKLFLKDIDNGTFISSANSYSINIASIAPEFDDYVYSAQCGVIKEHFSKVKEEFQYALMEVEEILYRAEYLVKINNPEEFVRVFERKLYKEYPFKDRSYGVAGDFMEKFFSLREGIADIKRFKTFLEEIGILDSVKEVSKSALELKDSLKKIIESSTDNRIILQVGVTDNKLAIIDEKDGNDTLFIVDVEKEKEYRGLRGVYKTIVNEDKLVDTILFRYRCYLEEKYKYEGWDE